ncbi:Na+/H+ antiporter subunit E [Candidatus Laterigemmans baculatus]|uniref:Na+/H+ antiporter subunit E n=1 Tax=Candidatus Laterigemmans baculatus TaxID=2770505 RepID=UPI0013DAE669|nr:Na+/H+ antiporter subunit E [Candidatus Laterigemmans baculatus]
MGNLLLAFVWSLMIAEFSVASLIMGFAFGFLLLWLFQPLVGGSSYFGKVRQIVRFSLFLAKEIVRANLHVAWHVITPSSFFKPGIIAVPLEPQTDFEATLLANILTLTPGSFSVDISTDRRVLYVHVMDVENAERTRWELKEQYETPLLEILRS